jgi:hypothetical protein
MGSFWKTNPFFAFARPLPGNPTARSAVVSYLGTEGIHFKEIALARGEFLIIVSTRC